MSKLNRQVNHIQAKFSLKAEVVLGAQERGCAGSGVCRLLPFKKIKNWVAPCSLFQTEISWYERTQQLSLSLDLKSLQDKEQLKWFSMPFFLMEEDFFFPLWFQHQSRQRNIYIPAGEYPFRIEKGSIQLFFVWKKENIQPVKKLMNL